MPMKTFVGIKILEMTDSGLHEIIQIESEPSKSEEEWQKSISDMVELIFKHEGLYMSLGDQGFVLKNISKKTIVVKGVFQN